MAEPSFTTTTTAPNHQGDVVADDPPVSLQDSNDTGEGGKIKMIIQLVKKCLGVKDIASMCVFVPPPAHHPPQRSTSHSLPGGCPYRHRLWNLSQI
jgi:hypothetical protein